MPCAFNYDRVAECDETLSSQKSTERGMIFREKRFFCSAGTKNSARNRVSALRGAAAWLAGVERKKRKEFCLSSGFWLTEGENTYFAGLLRAGKVCFVL